MSMERLKAMKERAISLAETGLNQDINCIDAKELGEIVDIVKDMTEAMYYCSITDAMNETDEAEKYIQKYLPELSYSRNYNPYYRMNDNRYPERMYYSSRCKPFKMIDDSMRNYNSYNNDYEVHDEKDGNSWLYRRNYMEDKELKRPEKESMQDLEDYAQTLTDDILELIQEATPREKEILKQKISTLASKI